MFWKRPLGGSCGVRPPCANHWMPRKVVRPAASMLMATPAMSLVALEGDGGDALEAGGADRDAEAGEEAEPDVAGDRGDGGSAEGGGQHLALEADVEDAGALGIEAGEAGEQQRRREPDGGVEGREDEAEIHRLSSRS